MTKGVTNGVTNDVTNGPAGAREPGRRTTIKDRADAVRPRLAPLFLLDERLASYGAV